MMEVVNAMLLLKLIISVLYVSIVDSVSSKCQTPLNSSDCGLPSTVVYTYYSPNSFCYPAIWRGCPTNNKFYNEDQCWKSCVMHFEVTESMPKEIDASKVQVQNNTKSQSVKINRCDVPLNTSRCTKKIKLVFTFSDVIKSCVIALWSGCPTENMFPDFTTCQNNCQEKKDDKLKQKDKSNIQQAPNFLQLDINNPNAQNKENKLVQKDESKMQEVPIDLKHLMKKPDASNEDIQIKQNYQSKVQKASNVPKKLVKKKNALNKEYKLDEKDIFKGMF
ncbi:uncharacterized protein LOC134665468 [Cydia fagiglandana]|uniref:uncharacterized protein LOC134665468 n=1 Tax=Cydia fagiglandana TaxID=1458189 RepID=UPI002FEE125D